jgi:hypothetical protein
MAFGLTGGGGGGGVDAGVYRPGVRGGEGQGKDAVGPRQVRPIVCQGLVRPRVLGGGSGE